jgi:hypothetical protein
MVPAWSLLVVLLAGAAAGWFLHSWLARAPLPARPASVAEPDPAPPAEPAQKMEAVLTELERRYQGRKAEPEAAKQRATRRPRAPKP